MFVTVTGGSRGIGAEVVRRFTARGDAVTFFYHRHEAEALALAKETGAKAVCCDVADSAAVAAAFSSIPRTDVLVCCAGISHMGLISEISEAEWRRLFAVNVDGVFHAVRAALPSMLHEQCGSIVTVSSMWGEVGASCEAAYSATKGAVIALTKALAKELGPSNIRVNCVSPGVILTDMCKNLDSAVLDELKDATPLGRNGTADDVADAIVKLADLPFVTGQILSVNGGFVM
ncbi:MAG: SDR family oxidoreductase [Oscillospiraceae bacterium]|nr:SDR family oxidoreductase [Oscillospiraceae bacterium]